MIENLVRYSSLYFKKNWDKLCNIRIDNFNIPNYLRKILKDYYGSKWIERTTGIKSGVFDTGHELDIEGRSLLNYIDTNYSVFAVLINWINYQILNKKIKNFTQIDFYLSSWINEIEKLFEILDIYKNDIFDNESEILEEIFKIVNKTSSYGDAIEKITIKKLKSFPGIKNIKQAEFGDDNDMFKGIDIEFTFRGKKWGVQCKSYTDIKYDGENYIIYGISHAKDYNPLYVNLYAFYHPKKGFFMFDNKETIRDGNTLYIKKQYKRNI